jgi:hypothetical protein
MTESEIYIGLSKPKTPTNVDVVMRAVSCFQTNAFSVLVSVITGLTVLYRHTRDRH